MIVKTAIHDALVKATGETLPETLDREERRHRIANRQLPQQRPQHTAAQTTEEAAAPLAEETVRHHYYSTGKGGKGR